MCGGYQVDAVDENFWLLRLQIICRQTSGCLLKWTKNWNLRVVSSSSWRTSCARASAARCRFSASLFSARAWRDADTAASSSFSKSRMRLSCAYEQQIPSAWISTFISSSNIAYTSRICTLDERYKEQIWPSRYEIDLIGLKPEQKRLHRHTQPSQQEDSEVNLWTSLFPLNLKELLSTSQFHFLHFQLWTPFLGQNDLNLPPPRCLQICFLIQFLQLLFLLASNLTTDLAFFAHAPPCKETGRKEMKSGTKINAISSNGEPNLISNVWPWVFPLLRQSNEGQTLKVMASTTQHKSCKRDNLRVFESIHWSQSSNNQPFSNTTGTPVQFSWTHIFKNDGCGKKVL